MMTTASQKSNKQVLDIKIEVLHDKKDVKAFKVHTKEGKFVVVDYADRFSAKPDTEVFWETNSIAVLPHTPEYKTANKAVADYLKQKSSK